MAITAIQRTELVSLLVGMFDAAPSAEILTEFVAYFEAGDSITDIANNLDDTEVFHSMYPTWLTNEDFASKFTKTIMDGNTDAAGLAVATSEVLALLNAGYSQGETAKIATDFLMAVDATDVVFGQAGLALQNKTEVATYHATQMLNADSSLESLQAVLANVNSTQQSVDDVKALIDLGVTSTADFDQVLTTDQDNLTGTAGNDSFAAWIFDNQNTAQSGDMISGGAGTDTLVAELGNSAEFAIALKTYSVEVAHFRAQASNAATPNGDNDNSAGGIDKFAQVDAQDMNGTTEFWSTESRANLHIEDVRNNSHETTLGWRSADAGDVNYEVYFDTQHITAPGTTTSNSQLFLEVLDLEGMKTDGEPLLNNPYTGVSFNMTATDGTVTTINIAAENPVQGAGSTYAELTAGINALLAEQGLTTVTAALGSTFSAINSSNGVSYEGTTIVLTNTGPEVLDGLGWLVNGAVPPSSNVHTAITDTPPLTSTTLTQVDVILDNVGRGSKSEDFVAGNISQGSNSGSMGIQQFNIDVDRNSWVNEIRSTNNTLEEVYVENIGAEGSVQIDKLEDVRVFDASAMTGETKLTANLGETVISKYLDLTDTNTNPAADNVNFNYTLGKNNDVLSLTVDEAAVGHEDFTLNAMGGDGNDVITVSVVDGGVLAATAGEWYTNQTEGVNVNELNVLGGTGNDTISVLGGGDYVVHGGAGDDTIYVDNTAAKATWVLGAAAGEAATYTGSGTERAVDIESDPVSAGIILNSKLTVSFNGFEAQVNVTPGASLVANQLTINNAIKAAILGDSVLSKLLTVEDGPGNVLLIHSNVDDVIAETAKPVIAITGTGSAGGGTYNAADIAALSATDLAALKAGDSTLDSASGDAAVAAAVNNALTAHNVHVGAANVEATTKVGAASAFQNDSTVNAGTGSNVIVLASEVNSTNTVVFDNTWTKTSIIGFEADNANAAFADVLDFTAFLTNTVSTSGSAESAVRTATTLNADATAEINSVTVSTAATFTTADSFAGLNGTNLLAALNGGTAYAGIVDGTLNGQVAAGGIANLQETEGEAVLLIQNNANVGEFKAFQLTWNDDSATNATGDFTAATLLGTIDFGSEDITVAGFTAAQLA